MHGTYLIHNSTNNTKSKYIITIYYYKSISLSKYPNMEIQKHLSI